MALTIETIYQTGATLYAVIRRRADGQVWNPTLNAGAGAFEAYAVGHWAQYAIPLVEQPSSGYYAGAYPTGIVNTLTSEVLYVQVGGSPASTDAPPFNIGMSQGQSIAAVVGAALDAANMAAALGVEITGAAVGTVPGPLSVTTNLPDTTDNVYLGRVIIFTSGAMIRQAARISGYVGFTKVLSVLSWPSNLVPQNGDTFIII
jgi:hypothetical protein